MDLSRRSFLATQGAALGALLLPGGLLSAVEAATPAAPALEDWAQVRAQFRLSRDFIHLAGFFIASHPEPVRAAIEGYRRAIDENPFLAVEQGLFESEATNLEHRVCEDIAAYLGARPEEIALTGNTTMGLALIYHGLPLKPGDEILTTTHDHVVHHESIRLSTQRNGASVRKIALFEEAAAATTEDIVGRIRAAIRPATRVLGLTWVHSATGIRLPIRRIADALDEINRSRSEAERVLLVVDGVHGLGAVEDSIPRMGCDFFSAGTHKWIFAPRGTGILWAPAKSWARLTPLIPTFSDMECFNAWAEGRPVKGPTIAARVCPGGFHAFEHQWAAGAAFRMHMKIGPARIADRVFELNDRCRRGLAAIPGVKLHTPLARELSAGINCFEVAGHSPAAVVKALLDKRIVASTSPYAITYARLSAGLMNTPEEVDQALVAVRALAS
ncbi:class V aminotransferase [Geothrix limicola]|uniref:Class V aminotransferase n=1 Tax=Geothrix limicola TaxID=2927978 RepID=A0ABQ5QF74_9BACT|nr:aminotransferase class V-fold PLP-dependent enzyme [Geothrix limicola]GLH73234.1 class V aminotransferase [Geothrix limicola]